MMRMIRCLHGNGLLSAKLLLLAGVILVVTTGCEKTCAEGNEDACLELYEKIGDEEQSEEVRETSRESLEAACEEKVSVACLQMVELTVGEDHTSETLSEVEDAISHAQMGCESGDSTGDSTSLCELQKSLESKRDELEEEARRRRAERARREAKERRKAAREEKVKRGMRTGELNCFDWASDQGDGSTSSERMDVCKALRETVRNGRTSHTARRTLKSYLKGEGLSRIHGYIVARIERGVYESVMRGYDAYWDVSYPRGKHFLLKTLVTEYSTKGRFNLWVTKVGTHRVDLRSGFSEVWDIYEESVLGELWQEVRSARAGEETSDAASSMLRAIR